jgi:hypothetical protein
MTRLRLAVFLIALAFSVTLAVIIGTRLSEQALAVIIGVVAGVAASIPTSLIIIWFATRSAASVSARTASRERAGSDESPRIVIVQAPPAVPPAIADPRYYVPPPAPTQDRPPSPQRRTFTIIGGDDSSLE